MVKKPKIYNIKMSEEEIIRLLCIVGQFKFDYRNCGNMFDEKQIFQKLMTKKMYNLPLFF